MLGTGHYFSNPVSAEILKEFNIKAFDELLEKDNLLHIGNAISMALQAQYLKEHYNLDVVFKINMANPMFVVYKQIKITPGMTDKLMSVPVSVPVGVKKLKYNIFVIRE